MHWNKEKTIPCSVSIRADQWLISRTNMEENKEIAHITDNVDNV